MNRPETIEKRLSEAPQSSRNTLREAFLGAASPRKAIKAMCLSCTGFDRVEIRDCTGFSCPLWAYRPFTEPPPSVPGALPDSPDRLPPSR